jgi:hypothetical protein
MPCGADVAHDGRHAREVRSGEALRFADDAEVVSTHAEQVTGKTVHPK